MVQRNQTNILTPHLNQELIFNWQSILNCIMRLWEKKKSSVRIFPGPQYNCLVLELSPFSFYLSSQVCDDRKAAGSVQISLFKFLWVSSVSVVEVGGVIYNHQAVCGVRVLKSLSCSDLCLLIQLHSFCLLMEAGARQYQVLIYAARVLLFPNFNKNNIYIQLRDGVELLSRTCRT